MNWSLEKTTCECKFWNFHPIEFPHRATKTKTSHLKTLWNSKPVYWHLDEKMQPVALEKNSSNKKKQEASNLYTTFDTSDLSTFRRNHEKRRYWHWMRLYKPNLRTVTLTEESVTLALRGTEFDYEEESHQISQYSRFHHFHPSGSRCEELNALFNNHKYFWREEKSRLIP